MNTQDLTKFRYELQRVTDSVVNLVCGANPAQTGPMPMPLICSAGCDEFDTLGLKTRA